MTTPNSIVAAKGEPVTITRVTDYTAGRDGVEGVTREYETVKGVVHSPTESQQQRLEGRLNDGGISVTFVSGTDVAADRDGGRDRLIRPSVDDPENPPADARIYTAIDVTRDKHALVGIEKLTVVYNEFGGRQDLSEDASQYVEAWT